MKIRQPQRYIPYGPAGHAQAGLFEHYMGTDKNDVEGAFYGWISRYSSQNSVPTSFFDEDKTLAENGYYIVPVQGDEVRDDLLAQLATPRMFTSVAPGEPGRKLQEFKSHIPYFYHHFDFEVWNEGGSDCDHDFGLESYHVMFREQYSDRIVDLSETYNSDMEGTYYAAVVCTRCGAKHALAERT